jgi:purine-binding chemotaxis protein CheW
MTRSIQDELQALWDDLNQPERERQQSELEKRLRQRAQQYVTASDDVPADADVYRLLTFSLGSERYGLDVSIIRGVRTVTRVTRVPGVPAFYRGVVNVRGRIISVLDLRLFFDLSVLDTPPPREIVLVEAHDLYIALAADHIEDVQNIPHAAVEPTDGDYTHGVTMGRLVVLDGERLFRDERLIIER